MRVALSPIRSRPRGPGNDKPVDNREAGFTLVEVMAAGTALSILVLCFVQGWTVLDRMMFDSLIRQKAVFVLNGEMERLAALYNTSTFGVNISSNTNYPTITNLPNSTSRSTYATQNNLTFTTTSATSFPAADPTVLLVPGTPPWNYVWLDRTRGLVARFSWLSCMATSGIAAGCWGQSGPVGSTQPCYRSSGTAPCQLVTVVLDFPYQLQSNVPVPYGMQTTLTLSTIVGQRRG